MSTTATAARLSRLESAGLIQLASPQPEFEYILRYVLVEEATYASLVRGDRRALHQVVAETLERLYLAGGPARGEVLALLAVRPETHEELRASLLSQPEAKALLAAPAA
jgi:hypothetical protein